MGMTAVCPSCGHAEPSSNRRGARLGSCPQCGTPMRAHTAGKAKGRYICPVAGGVFTHGLGGSIELTQPMRLVFQPGWDNNWYEPDPERPLANRPVTYRRTEPDASEQRYLDRAAGRVFGPGCVISRDFTPSPPSDPWYGKAGVYLVPAADADAATWFVNEPVTYKKCAACPAKVIASDENRMDRDWVPARQSYWRGSGWRLRRIEISQGPHLAGSYACRGCRPGPPALAQPRDGLPAPDGRTTQESGGQPSAAAHSGPAETEPGKPVVRSGSGAVLGQSAADGFVPAGDGGAVPALHAAIGVISSVCDYAKELDAQGFNAADTWLGHVLAQMPAAAWTGEEALAAWDMLRKYRGQLAAAGIDHDQLPRPAGAGELEAGRRADARERARQHARAWRDQQYRQARTYLRCDGNGEQVTLAFPYDPDLVAACRRIPGRRYDGAAKANVFPFTSLPAVTELAAAHAIEVTADVRALAVIAAGQAAGHAALPQIRLDERDGSVIIDAPFNPDLTQALKDANGGRSTWDRTARVHRLPARAAADLPALAARSGLRVADQAHAAIAAETGRQDRNRAAASAAVAGPVPVPGLAAGMPLKPQQYPVVRFALEHRRVLIGDDMGWGKTLSSLAAVAAGRAWPAVVVCRPSLTLNWAAEIARFFPALTVYQATGTTPQPVPPGTDVVIIGSAALAAKPRQADGGGKEFGWVTALAAAAPKALIIDEGQDTKERAASRSQACEQLAAAVTAGDGLVLDLTGTAILNRPRELCQQLTILGRIGEFGGPKAFLWRYCLSETNEWGASYNGARNLIELHDRLRAWGIMIRRSDDTALGLPPCREHVLRIGEADLDPAVMARYRQAEADLLAYLAGQARTTALRLGEDPASAAVKAAMVTSAAERAEHLVAINTLRQLAGQAKRGYVTGWVREQVAAGEKVMVAAHHRDQVDAYAAEFGGLKLQGGQPVEEKEAAKAAFQQLPAAEAPVIAVAIGAGGVGHTLTAARIGIQAEQAWTPGDTQQMKKRLHRIGQDRPVDYHVTVAEGTIDEHLWQVVTAKQATLNAVLDGRSDDGIPDDEASIAAELTWRLTQQGLGNPGSDSAASCAGSSQPGQAAGRDAGVPDDGSHGGEHASSGRSGTPPAAVTAPSAASRGGPPAVPGVPPGRGGSDGDDQAQAQARISATGLRESAHRYLDEGLWPVPAWGITQHGECCCWRGAECPRPGKHPRSVPAGPGQWSWQPLACRDHDEVDRRFAPGGQYATGNLMVAIPPGMMAIDRDDDDGGRTALAALAGELGELPPTLAHRTPHGEHLVYRTPPGWTGRAWVGKDPANPVPAGIDLRMPGQILMAPPSVVPGPDGPARYGPASGGPVAALPAAYVAAWTPPQPPPRPAAPRVPVPAQDADRAARYVHDAMARITGDLAGRDGARNSAAYTAGLKAGSLLGAARITPGAETAAGAWTDEAAEAALLEAARANGYVGKDGEAEARRAIQSGLKNGLRSPRTLPDFTTSRPAQARPQRARPAVSGPAQPSRAAAPGMPGRRAARWQDLVPAGIRQAIDAADQAANERRRAASAAYQRALAAYRQSGGSPEAGTELERSRAEADAAYQAYTQDGRHVTGRHDAAMLRWAASIAAQRDRQATGTSGGQPGTPRMLANRAAVAANEAYRAGDLDRARQLVDQAAAADASRAGLWQQHRQQIAARQLIHRARAAHAEGDHQGADKLLADARQLDPRMAALWDGDLPALPRARTYTRSRGRDIAAPGPGNGRSPAADAGRGDHAPAALAQAAQQAPQPSWPRSPARREPHHPAPDVPGKADRTQPPAPRPPAAAPREPRARPRAAGHEADASAEPDGDPAARWPAPSPRAARQAGPPGQQAGHEAAPAQQPDRSRQISPAPETGPGRTADADTPAAPSADWRDEVLRQARQPWQPAPSWPASPALHQPPGPGTPEAGIEPSDPDASIQ